MKRVCLLALAITVLFAGLALAQSNIDSTDKNAWSENVGWMNWRDANGGASGAHVGSGFMSGHVWNENVGWISLGDGTPLNGFDYTNQSGADSGVNVDPSGILWGYAWGENIGWIQINAGQFANPPQPAYLGCDGRLHGYAWAENVGWINLSLTAGGQFVEVDSQTTPYLCDMNHDGFSNGRDVQGFVSVLLNGNADWRDICSGDVDASNDGVVDINDVDAFTACLLNG
jgi:hypothetical protein